MRAGQNVAKASDELPSPGRHRVIVPVYMPVLDGYFRHGMEVLRLCLQSLRVTTRDRASVTLISNGSAVEVQEMLRRQYEEGWVDQLLISRQNRGKVDAVISAARGAFENLITIADCDVLFMPGWLEAVEGIFRHFPECGFASPAPNPRLSGYYTSATTLGALVRRELGYKKVVPEIDLDRFASSIGRSDFFRQGERSAQLIVRRRGAVACVGCGHFVFTIRREVLGEVPKDPSRSSIERQSEEIWLDRPGDVLGVWRLATTRAYAYHMGNVPEAWMYKELEASLRQEGEAGGVSAPLPGLRRGLISRSPWWLRSKAVAGLKRLRVGRARGSAVCSEAEIVGDCESDGVQ